MELQPYKHLLQQVTTLNNHYKKINQLTGENFNIFRILKLEASEVRLHSAFLASLLDPKGQHGQKHIFLKLFIDRFCFKQAPIDLESCTVEIEKHTGFISANGVEGGRIDIVISDKFGHHIIIENKIYAGDQNNQLTRYYNYSPNADLIYLTLYGKEPSKGSCGDLINNTHFKCYSYKSDILQWLEACRKEVAVYPIVRESITQYINLIRHLTNQTVNHNMQEELNQLLISNLEASFIISDNLDNSLIKVFDDFAKELQEACEALGFNFSNKVDLDKNYSGIFIWKADWKYVNIGFQFQAYDKDLIYGMVCKLNPDKEPIPEALRKQLSAISKSGKTSAWWPCLNRMEAPLDNWSRYNAWKALTDGTMKRAMLEKIQYLSEMTKEINL